MRKVTPLLMKGPLVVKTLSGKKTQTRRIINPQPEIDQGFEESPGWCFTWGRREEGLAEKEILKLCPYGRIGDLLYVRETITSGLDSSGAVLLTKYAADNEFVCYRNSKDPEYDGSVAHWEYKQKSRPAIHMPRKYSRLTLELIEIRIEKLQSMKHDDALAEGIGIDILPADDHSPQCMCYVTVPDDNHAYVTAIDAFKNLWNRINEIRGFSWDKNPWVWVLEYKAHHINVDDFLQAENA